MTIYTKHKKNKQKSSNDSDQCLQKNLMEQLSSNPK